MAGCRWNITPPSTAPISHACISWCRDHRSGSPRTVTTPSAPDIRRDRAPEPASAGDRDRDRQPIDDEARRIDGKESIERAGEPQHDPAAAEHGDDAQQPAEQRPAEAAGALAGEVKRDAEAEEAEERTDGAQIGCAGGE